MLLRRSGERHPSQGLKAGVDRALEEFAKHPMQAAVRAPSGTGPICRLRGQREFRLDRDVQKAIERC